MKNIPLPNILTKITAVLILVICTMHISHSKPRSVWSNQGRGVKKNYFDFGLCTGLGNYYGDIVPTLTSVRQLHPAMGIFSRYNIGQYFALRGTLTVGAISGDDKYYRNKARNLSFRSQLEEVAITAEINLKSFHAFSRTKNGFAPYFFFGIAGFHFNPQAQYDGKWYDLQPLGTEGQGIAAIYGSKYPLYGISLPIGGGLKYRFETSYNHYITVGAEFGIRKTFTDYLDDVSSGRYMNLDSIRNANGTMAANFAWREDEYFYKPKGTFFPDIRRGNPQNKDWYYFGNITVSYVFGRKKLRFAR